MRLIPLKRGGLEANILGTTAMLPDVLSKVWGDLTLVLFTLLLRNSKSAR